MIGESIVAGFLIPTSFCFSIISGTFNRLISHKFMNLIKNTTSESVIYNPTSCNFSSFSFISVVISKSLTRYFYVSG